MAMSKTTSLYNRQNWEDAVSTPKYSVRSRFKNDKLNL